MMSLEDTESMFYEALSDQRYIMTLRFFALVLQLF